MRTPSRPVDASRRRFLRGTLVMLAAGATGGLASACAAAAPAGAPAPAATANPAAPAAAAPAASTPHGDVAVALSGKVIGMDPHGAQSGDRITLTVARQIFDTLVVRNPTTGAIEPSLATSWQTPDDLTWVFALRQGVKFHDGSPFTSADVKASIERVIAQKGPAAPLWAGVDTVEAPDASTVRIKTKVPQGPLLANATLLYVAPAARMNEPGFFNNPVGIGPFKVASWRPDADLVLNPNMDYWGGPPALKTLTFRQILETAAVVTALETGEIQFASQLPPDQLPTLRGNPDLKVEAIPSYIYYFIWMNAKRDPFIDKRVRQAMAYALDVDTIVKDLFQGVGQRARAPIPSTVFGFVPQTPYVYDPARAKQLLSDAGYPNGIDTTLTFNPAAGLPQGLALEQTMLSYWNKAGIRVQGVEKESGQYLADLLGLNWDIVFQTNPVLTGDADYSLRRLYLSSANRTGYANPDLDKVLNDAAQALDQKARQDLYAQADKIIWDDAVGIFPIELLGNYVYRKTVTGFVAPPNDIPSFASISIA